MPARSNYLDTTYLVHFLNTGSIRSVQLELAFFETGPVRAVPTHTALHVPMRSRWSPIELDIFGQGWVVGHISFVHVGPRRSCA